MSLYLKQIEQLVALQKVDDEIYVIRKDLNNAPKEIEGLRSSFAQMEEQRNKLLEKITHLQEQERRVNQEIEDDAARIKKSKNKLMMVGNSKEYHAMMREMDSMERSNRTREEEKMALSEELTRQNEALAALEGEYSNIKADLEVKEAGLAERMDKAKNTLVGLDASRREAGQEVPLPVLSRYEFIRERLEHPVIVPVENGVCSGCHISIPPQSYIELQKGSQILSCPNCQRLIYWSEHFCES